MVDIDKKSSIVIGVNGNGPFVYLPDKFKMTYPTFKDNKVELDDPDNGFTEIEYEYIGLIKMCGDTLYTNESILSLYQELVSICKD